MDRRKIGSSSSSLIEIFGPRTCQNHTVNIYTNLRFLALKSKTLEINVTALGDMVEVLINHVTFNMMEDRPRVRGQV